MKDMMISSEMQATYKTLNHYKTLVHNGVECEVTLHRLVTRLTSHFKSIYSWYTELDWDSKYEYMASVNYLLKIMKCNEAWERFSVIDNNLELHTNLMEQTK